MGGAASVDAVWVGVVLGVFGGGTGVGDEGIPSMGSGWRREPTPVSHPAKIISTMPDRNKHPRPQLGWNLLRLDWSIGFMTFFRPLTRFP
jgi:hypothetical protein